jgi:hypothetical protein
MSDADAASISSVGCLRSWAMSHMVIERQSQHEYPQ